MGLPCTPVHVRGHRPVRMWGLTTCAEYVVLTTCAVQVSVGLPCTCVAISPADMATGWLHVPCSLDSG